MLCSSLLAGECNVGPVLRVAVVIPPAASSAVVGRVTQYTVNMGSVWNQFLVSPLIGSDEIVAKGSFAPIGGRQQELSMKIIYFSKKAIIQFVTYLISFFWFILSCNYYCICTSMDYMFLRKIIILKNFFFLLL